VVADHEFRRRQLAALLELTQALEEAGCAPVVLKGAPLAQRLYGDPLLRPTSDLDLYVALEQRERSLGILRSHGWRHREGAPPWEEVFERSDGPYHLHLELHYSLRDDTLAHIPLPPPCVERVTIDGVSLPAFGGPMLPAYLAAHLVKHQVPPLLWRLDFATLWDSLGHYERRRAEAAARAVRLHRYLTWAIREADRIVAAAAGDRAAARALGFAADVRRDMHAMVRTAVLAATATDAVRVLGAWAWPRNLRRDGRGTLSRLAERVTTPLRRVAVKTVHYLPAPSASAAAAPRALDVSSDELLALVSEVVDRDGTLWIRARGHSMEPAVPNGAMLRVGPPSGRPLRRGDVVLARLPTGVPAVHRVIDCGPHTVRLRGDAQFADDPPVAPSDVLAIVDLVAIDGRAVPVSARPRPALWRRLAGAGRRWRMRWVRPRTGPGDPMRPPLGRAQPGQSTQAAGR
jgi:hypothetical protein